ERLVGARLPAAARVESACRRSPVLLYVGGIVLITLTLAGLLVATAHGSPVNVWTLGLIAVLSMVAASQLAVALVNWVVTLLATPQALPRMDYSTGIPPECRTLVVVPAMLANAGNGQELIEALEPEDEGLLRRARQGIEDLNARYKSGGACFFLLHRPRRWNAQERRWMGYERKRGKLGALNAFLRGGPPDAFSLTVGDMAKLANVKYVITLDTDTQLPRDAARQLVGAMAH